MLPLSAAKADCVDPPAPGVDWTRCYFDERSFQGVDLSGAKMKGATFNRADLSNADLAKADLRRGKLISADCKALRSRVRGWRKRISRMPI